MNTTFRKVLWVGALLFVFLLVLATNLVDRDHIKGVRTSVSTMYEDRLIVKNLIYNISNLTEEKRIAFLVSDTNFYTQNSITTSDSISNLLNKFSNTNLTYNEKKYLERLHTHFKNIRVLEKQPLSDTSIIENVQWRNNIKTQLSHTRKNLDKLAIIQIDEGKRELARVNRAFNTIDLFTSIEIAFLVAIGIVALLIVIYPINKKKNK